MQCCSPTMFNSSVTAWRLAIYHTATVASSLSLPKGLFKVEVLVENLSSVRIGFTLNVDASFVGTYQSKTIKALFFVNF